MDITHSYPDFLWCNSYLEAIAILQSIASDKTMDWNVWVPEKIDQITILKSRFLKAIHAEPGTDILKTGRHLILCSSVDRLRKISRKIRSLPCFQDLRVVTSVPREALFKTPSESLERKTEVSLSKPDRVDSIFLDAFEFSLNHDSIPCMPDLSVNATGDSYRLADGSHNSFFHAGQYIKEMNGYRIRISFNCYNIRIGFSDLNQIRANTQGCNVSVIKEIYRVTNLLFHNKLTYRGFLQATVKRVDLASYIPIHTFEQDAVLNNAYEALGTCIRKGRRISVFQNGRKTNTGFSILGRNHSLVVYNPGQKPKNTVQDRTDCIKIEVRQRARRGKCDSLTGIKSLEFMRKIRKKNLASVFLNEVRRVSLNGSKVEDCRLSRKILRIHAFREDLNESQKRAFDSISGLISLEELQNFLSVENDLKGSCNAGNTMEFQQASDLIFVTVSNKVFSMQGFEAVCTSGYLEMSVIIIRCRGSPDHRGV